MMLSVEAIEAGYGGARVLQGVDFDLGEGQALALIGRNGMGKTTTVRALFGLLPLKAGRIVFEGGALSGRPPYAIARAGLGLVPEGRQVFPSLTVDENLVATAAARHGRGRWTLGEVFRLFPRLAERRRNFGDQLSGGEQQMLAIGRALMTNPKLIVLDEATEGLAPLIRVEIWDCLKRLKGEGQSILVIDKNLKALIDFVDRIAVIEKGTNRLVRLGRRVSFRAINRRTLSSCRRRSRADLFVSRVRRTWTCHWRPVSPRLARASTTSPGTFSVRPTCRRKFAKAPSPGTRPFRLTRSCRRISTRCRTSSSTCSRASSN